MKHISLWILGLLVFAVQSYAVDYLDLKDGRRLSGAIIRQDTTAVYMTQWQLRGEQFPPLEVYSRDEVRAIWFGTPGSTNNRGTYYRPRNGLFEIGGGALLQTWEASDLDRRTLIQVSCFGAMSISPVVGLEADMDLTMPSGGKNDPNWKKLIFSHHVSMNLVAHLPWKQRVIPYVLAGGGFSDGIPIAGLIFSENSDAHNMLQAGIGLKYGIDRIGFRVELRHAYYIWQEDQLVLDPNDYTQTYIERVRMDADATMLRFFIFSYF